MRVISGIYKRRRFDVPHTFKARPTTDFAKENLFNVLCNNYIDFEENITALDLFAGTGSISIELVSRGCDRVISIENCNARYLSEKEIPEPVDLMVMDVSFISQTKLYGALIPLLKDGGLLLSLIKPQFEVGRSGIGKGGIVRDEKKRAEAVTEVVAFAAACGLFCDAVIPSPIRGGDGNIEFLVCFQKRSSPEEREVSYED